MFRFKIIGKCFQDATYNKDDSVDFLLEENDWNDYGYYTTYHLHISDKYTGKGAQYLGYISIMQIGQEINSFNLLSKHFYPEKTFTHIPSDFISLSDSLNLYTTLSQYLITPEEKREFIDSLNIILH